MQIIAGIPCVYWLWNSCYSNAGKAGKAEPPSLRQQQPSPVHTAPEPSERGLASQAISAPTGTDSPNVRMIRWSSSNWRTNTTVSAFQAREKVLVFLIMAQDQGFQEVFQGLAREWQLSNKLYRDLQWFTRPMYRKNAGTNKVNELRYRLVCWKKVDVDFNQLPSCDDSLRKHGLRANYQATIWKRSVQRCPEIPSPLGCGSCTEDGRVAID